MSFSSLQKNNQLSTPSPSGHSPSNAGPPDLSPRGGGSCCGRWAARPRARERRPPSPAPAEALGSPAAQHAGPGPGPGRACHGPGSVHTVPPANFTNVHVEAFIARARICTGTGAEPGARRRGPSQGRGGACLPRAAAGLGRRGSRLRREGGGRLTGGRGGEGRGGQARAAMAARAPRRARGGLRLPPSPPPPCSPSPYPFSSSLRCHRPSP